MARPKKTASKPSKAKTTKARSTKTVKATKAKTTATKRKSNVVSLKSAKTKKAAAPVAKVGPIAKKQTKVEIYNMIAERTGTDKKTVKAVLEGVRQLIECHMMQRGSGEFTIPAVAVKVARIEKPATKARKGINPFTGEEIQIAAKPKRKAIKVRALKSLKALVE